jgi:hypothetical protein
MKSGGAVKKTYNLPPDLISRARRILGTKTETETIIRSLEEVAFLDEVARAVKSTSRKFPGFEPLR